MGAALPGGAPTCIVPPGVVRRDDKIKVPRMCPVTSTRSDRD